MFSEDATTKAQSNIMESAGEEQGGEPEVTVETVPDNIESGYSDAKPGLLTYINYYLLGYFSNTGQTIIFQTLPFQKH